MTALGETYLSPLSYDAGFDNAPEELRGRTEIASGIYRYRRAAERLQAYHTGSTEIFLSVAEEQELATDIQRSLVAREEIERVAATDEESAVALQQQYNVLLESGKAAEHKLIETNLRLAGFYARASMNILSPRKKSGMANRNGDADPLSDDAPDTGQVSRGVRVGAYSDITRLRSTHADLEERTQVANLALVEAAHTFVPKVHKDGKPITFFTHATYQIHSALSRYAKTDELPGWHVYGHTVSEIYNARRHPEKYTPEKLVDLEQCGQGRLTTPLDGLRSSVVAPEETDYYTGEPASLSLAEIAQDRSVDVERVAMHGLLAANLRSSLDALSEREAGVIAMRYGVSTHLNSSYGQSASYDDIGRVYGVTRERIRQIDIKVRGKLSRSTSPESLDGYLELLSEQATVGHPLSPLAEGTINIRKQRTLAHNGEAQLSDERDSGVGLQLWQTYSGEPWELPKSYENIARDFTHLLFYGAPYHFQKSFAAEMGTEYPMGLVQTINEELGANLTVSHIEDFWNNHLERFIERFANDLGNDFDLDRISTLLMKLFSERMDDNSSIELRIPERLAGQLNFIGSWLQHGQLNVCGQTGDFTGYKLSGLATVKVHGSVGDFAAVEADNLAALEIYGNAGHFLAGQAAGTASIIVHGSVGDNCGDEISGEGVVIEIDGDAGEEIAHAANKGTVIIHARAVSVSSDRGNEVIVAIANDAL